MTAPPTGACSISWRPYGGCGLAGNGLQVYRASRPGATPGDVLAAVITDWFFRVPAIRVAEARIAEPRGAAAAARTWMYRFDYPEPRANHGFGACHVVEIPYVFDSITRDELRPLLGDAPSQAVADRAHRVWVDFVTRGSLAGRPTTPAAAPPGCSRRDQYRRRSGWGRARTVGGHPLTPHTAEHENRGHDR